MLETTKNRLTCACFYVDISVANFPQKKNENENRIKHQT